TAGVLLPAEPLGGGGASGIGMVHRVVPPSEIEAATYALAGDIAANAPLSLAGIKASLLRAVSLRERVDHADLDELARRAHLSADAAEGRRAMLEKRRPVFPA